TVFKNCAIHFLEWYHGLCCKNSRGNTRGVKPPFLFSLDYHSKQAGDERNLPHDVSFFHTTHLPFPHHVHDLISLSRVPSGLKGKKAQPGFDASLDEAMVLFDDVVEVLDLPQFD